MYRNSLEGNNEFMYDWKGDRKLHWKEDFPFKVAELPRMYQRSTKKIVTQEEVKSLIMKKIQEYFSV
ncbi:hypothetical protein HY837_02520 [archaeon]|nr:hypothetical protein [archaeon]